MVENLHPRRKRPSLKEAILVSIFHRSELCCGALSLLGSSSRSSFLIVTSPTQSSQHHLPGKAGLHDYKKAHPEGKSQRMREKHFIRSSLRGPETHRLGSPFRNSNAKLQTENFQGPSWGSGRASLLSPSTRFYPSCKPESFLHFLLLPELLFPEYYVG